VSTPYLPPLPARRSSDLAQLAARAGGMLHGAVVSRGEHEADADRLDAARHLLRSQIQIDAGGFQQVGTAALAGDRAVAVLGDPRSTEPTAGLQAREDLVC